MKLGGVLVALFAICSPVMAQTSECQSIAKASDRLACYDRAMPPTARGKPAATAPASSAQAGQFVDALAAENARLDVKINNICRGC
jgi:hypothetical protein